MYSLAVHPPISPTTRNRMVKNEPKTKLTANMFFPPGNYLFLFRVKRKLKIDGNLPI